MDENGVSKPCLHLLQAKGDNFYPMLFGIACGLFASEGLSNKVMNDERWLDTRDKMVQGSAHLLGLLIWRVQRHEVDAIEKRELIHKLEAAEKEVQELKKRRTEDARANEKVVSIFASREQAWFCERRTMKQHIGALVNDFRVLERMKHEEISELTEKLHQMELSLRYKNDIFEEEGMKKKVLESLVEELREAAKNNQHWLEGEVCTALKQAETAKQHLDIVLKEKNDSMLMVQNLSIELEKAKEDLEQKDKILSTLLRKSKLNTEDKRMMLKAVKLSKARVSEPKSERQTLRSILSKKGSSKFGASEGNSTAVKDAAHTNHLNLLLKGQIPKHLNLLTKQQYKFHSPRLKLTLGNTRVCTKFETSKDEQIKKELKAEKNSVEAPQQLLFVKNDKTEPVSKDASYASSSEEATNLVSMEIVEREASTTECSVKGGLLLDIHALGVSYKIKRLKQLLLMLEKVTGKQGDVHSGEIEGQDQTLLSLLNRQATRYNTLQDKADDLCKRMHEKDLKAKQGQSTPIRTKEASKRLENFLDETFQLQRLIVASGQKQMEIQSKIVCGFTGIAEKLQGSICSFDMRRFSDNIMCLFREVQKGLEVRIARVIGEIEGTLASNVIRSRQQ